MMIGYNQHNSGYNKLFTQVNNFSTEDRLQIDYVAATRHTLLSIVPTYTLLERVDSFYGGARERDGAIVRGG